MNISDEELESQEPIAAHCDNESLHVRLADGREISTPLWWYPSLLHASNAQRNNMELMYTGIHWPDLDEDLSIEGMLKGRKYPNVKPPVEAAE